MTDNEEIVEDAHGGYALDPPSQHPSCGAEGDFDANGGRAYPLRPSSFFGYSIDLI